MHSMKIDIPDIVKKKKSIEFLKNCNLDSVSEEILFEHLDIIIKGYGQNIFDTGFDLILYRGINYSIKPSTWGQLIYPPKEYAKINRASDEGIQMFYCSNLKKAPFYELFVKKGDRIVLSTWILKERLLFADVGYTKSNPFSPEISRDVLLDTFSSYPIMNDNDYIAEFLSTAFSKKILPGEISYYKLTNAIAKIFLFAKVADETDYNKLKLIPRKDIESEKYLVPQIDGLHYPTIQNTGMGENFAIKPEVIDNGLLEIDKIEYIEITDIIDNRYQYKIIDISFEINDSNIVWQNLDHQWSLFDDTEDINFVEESGQFEAYTSNGEKLEPL
jgi:hypothetical protein